MRRWNTWPSQLKLVDQGKILLQYYLVFLYYVYFTTFLSYIYIYIYIFFFFLLWFLYYVIEFYKLCFYHYNFILDGGIEKKSLIFRG